MNHKLKSFLMLALLFVIIASIGFFASKGGMTGGAIGDIVGKIACYQDQDCDDKIAETQDICRNPGTEYSLCVNKPLE